MTAKIYIASKTRHAPRWLELRAYVDVWWPGECKVISSWIDEAGPGETVSFSDLWIRCVQEASSATALIVYAEPDDVLKGALVEVGAALGNGVRVFVVGVQPGWSFVNHPLVTKCESIEDAFRRALGV